jgi:hypothetical protein
MSISAERAERLAQRARHLTPGRHAGRTVDGVDLIIDGEPAGRMPPRWIAQLEKLGYVAATDGPVEFDVLIDGRPRCRLGDIREALYEALASIAAGCHPDRVRVEALAAGRSVEVVRGHQVIGMAIGALEDEPLLVIEGPSVLPAYAPGEKRPQRHLRRHRR